MTLRLSCRLGQREGSFAALFAVLSRAAPSRFTSTRSAHCELRGGGGPRLPPQHEVISICYYKALPYVLACALVSRLPAGQVRCMFQGYGIRRTPYVRNATRR
jgi:hypothetical protein